MNEIRSNLVAQIRERGYPIPPDLRSALSPAIACLEEWSDYWLEIPEAEWLRVGNQRLVPVRARVFRLRFENRLGLARIQPFADGASLCAPIAVEVVSSKFPSPQEHCGFFRVLLEDLFARSARLPFDLAGPTERGVTESLQPPTPLFVLHFLSQYADKLRGALALIQARPHRCLAERIDRVPLAEASQVDAGVLQDIVRSPERWTEAQEKLVVTRRLAGYAPTHVRQSLPTESSDTPENRFVHHFLRQLLVAGEKLLVEPWWSKVPTRRRSRVRAITSLTRRVYQHPMFETVGPMRYLPLRSQVLLQRDGYRTLLDLWRRFHCARRPFFGRLQEAIELRDIATLYEVWVFFALIDRIGLLLEQNPSLTLETSARHGLSWHARARFPGVGTLVYNRGFRERSYSVALRPDFSWVESGTARVVLDAKFRLERLPSSDEEDSSEATAKRSDLYKMHTYRDALENVRAAMALYPGSETLFYDQVSRTSRSMTLEELLVGNASGIGALPLRPVEKET